MIVAGLLVAAAAITGALLYAAGHPVQASSAPLYAHWLPHAGWGTPLAVAIATLVIWRGRRVAESLRWRTLLAVAYPAAVAWILSLALVDGWQRGVAGRLTTPAEYLTEVPGVTDVPAMLRDFTGGIAGAWTTHVAGHPPGALLVFVGLDRVGLRGGGWAGLLCILVGALVAVAVPITLRALGDEAAARAAVPFLVLFPGAVWIGVSADGLFAGVTAMGVALLAMNRAFAAGVLLAFGVYLSYGLVLMALIALAVVVAARRWRQLVWATAGAAAVVAAFTAAGFWWLDGYHLVRQRYHEGLASRRPYAYWVWANLAALLLSAGPATVPIVRRALRPPAAQWPASDPPVLRPPAARWPASDPPVLRPRAVMSPAVGRGALRPLAVLPSAVTGRALRPAVLLPLAAVAAILIADLSGLSKAEVERIWLPFAVWLPAGAILLTGRRHWLIAQAATALLVNHLFLTTW